MSIPGSASPLFFTAAADAAAFTLERSVRFDNDSSAHLKRTPSSAGDQQTWTWSAWIKGCTGVNDQVLFFSGDYNAANDYVYFGIMNTGFFRVEIRDGTTLSRNNTNNLLRDPAAWYHIVVQADFSASAAADRMNVWINNEEVSWLADDRSDISTSFNYAINKSGKEHIIGALKDGSPSKLFNGYMADVYLIDGSALDPTSFGAYDDNGVWQAKDASGLTFGTNGFHLDFADNSTASALGTDTSGNDNDWSVSNFSVSQGDQVYSSGASYEGNAVLYSNEPAGAFGKPGISDWGVTYSPSGSPSLTSGGKVTFPTALTNVTSVKINYKLSGGSGAVFINDNSTGITNLGSTSFVEVDVTSLLTNSSTPSTFSSIIFGPGNQNYGMRLKYIEVNGVRLTDSTYNYLNDSLLDSPTNGDSSDDTGAGGEVSGNYATINPLHANVTNMSVTDGNLDVTRSQTSQGRIAGTIGISSGKYYFEATRTTTSGIGNNVAFGVTDVESAFGTGQYGGNPTSSGGASQEWVLTDRSTAVNGSTYTNLNSTLGNVTEGDVVQVAVDMTAGKIWFGRNGTFSGTPASGSSAAFSNLSGTVVPLFYVYNGGWRFNAGQRAFAYSAPSGFSPLCTTTLPTPTIADGSEYFDATLYTGNGSTQSISVANHSPDLVWVKSRNDTTGHRLFDTVRGDYKFLESNSTGAETTNTNQIAITSSGFDTGASVNTNDNNDTYVAWTWDAGSSTASNTDGSQTSQVRANQTAGFSIATFNTPSPSANFTYGHGLNSAPEFVIHKFRDVSSNWYTYHTSIGQKYINLNGTGAAATSEFTTAPTSSVFTYPSSLIIGADEPVVAYSFTSVAGYSAFGSYEGNANNDGPFVYTGFRPAFVLTKWADGTDQWQIHDTSRSPDNVASEILIPNTNSDEKTYVYSEIDILSNGFKLRNSNQNINASSTYIYAAFAENPFQANGGLAR